jgi:hypothetical protein
MDSTSLGTGGGNSASLANAAGTEARNAASKSFIVIS